MKKVLDLIFMIVGGSCAIVLAMMAIVESKAQDLVSMLPLTMICCSLFVAGYISYFSKK